MGQIGGFLEEVQANRESTSDGALIERSAVGQSAWMKRVTRIQ
jgi:hypothetical protein